MKGNKGRKVFNNGVVNKYFDDDDTIPEGFVPGFKKRSEEEKRASAEKRKKTCLEKYGVEHPAMSDEVKKKQEDTCMKRYGVKAPSMNQEIKDKAAQTNLERYGYYSSAMAPEVKEKAAQTCIERYGFKSSAMSDEIKEKARKTCLERYGDVAPTKSKEILDKVKETNKERFGVDYYSKTEEFKERFRQTSLERYGVESPSQSEIVKAKTRITCQLRLGTEVTFQSEVCKEKAKQTMLKHYGVENPSQSDVIQERKIQTSKRRYGTDYPQQSDNFKEKVRKTNMERYGVEWFCQHHNCRAASSNDSGPNKEFASILDAQNVCYEREFVIGGRRYSYDFKVGNILIEIDPFATHNSLWGLFKEEDKKEVDYHQKKSHTAEAHGYQVIHIFDWDDQEKIIQNLLIRREQVYARKTKVFGIDKKEVSEFLNEHHIQGSCNGQSVCLGLRDGFGELISLMTFGKPRYNKNYEYELLRYCSSKAVVGGAEKLFKHFIKTYEPKSIISYCDRAKFLGSVYGKLGFTRTNEGKPSCHWYSPSEKRHITDNLLRARGYDQLFNESYGKGTSNEELIIKRGYVPIYDCGQDTYVWKR